MSITILQKLKIMVWFLKKFLFMFSPAIFLYFIFSVGHVDFNPAHWHRDAIRALFFIVPLAPLMMIVALAASYQLDKFLDDFPNKK